MSLSGLLSSTVNVLEIFYLWTHLWVVLQPLTVVSWALQCGQQQREGGQPLVWYLDCFNLSPGLDSGKDLWRRKEDSF